MKRRKIKILNKSFQYRYSIYFASIGAITFVLFALPTYYIIHSNYNLFLETGVKIAPEIVETLSREQSLIKFLFLFLFSISTLFLFIAGIIFTHKISGPMFAFSKNITEILEGNYTKFLKLRKDDELHELQHISERIKKALFEKELEKIALLKRIKYSENMSEEINEYIKDFEIKYKNISFTD